jgi:hypothetical protein
MPTELLTPNTAGTLRWNSATQRLRFTFGEFRLFSWKFPALVCAEHFTTLAADPAGILLPFDRLGAGLDAIVIPSCPLASELPAVTRDTRAMRYVPWQFEHYCIELRAASLNDYLAGLNGKTRHEHLRKLRRFQQLSGTTVCREYRTPAEMEEYLRVAGELARKTYQSRLLGAGLPDTAEFRRATLYDAGRGLVRGYLLFHEQKPIAYGHCCGDGDVLYYEHTGYDAEYANSAPGVALLHHILERAFEERRFRLLDFGHGNAQWKRSYATASAHCASVYYFRPTIGNAIRIAAHRHATAFSDSTVNLLERLGLKARLKRLFRSM